VSAPAPGAGERPLVSVLVAAYNEEALIATNLPRICDYMDTLAERYRWEMIVVDDGSTDRTAELAQEFAAGRDNVRVLRHPMNFRLGQALRYGISQCRGQYIVTLDVDLSYDPRHVGALLERIRETRAKIVLASPYMKGGRTTRVPFVRRMLSRWGNRFLALTARGLGPAGNLSTLTGITRAYDARFLRSLNLTSAGAEINAEILYKALILDARVEEIPGHLDWTAQRKAHAVRRSGMRIPRGILFSLLTGFIIRPFAFFIIPGLLLLLVAAYVTAWIGIHVARHYGEVSATAGRFDPAISEALARAFEQSPHAFIVGGITLIVAMQLIGLGLLALQLKQYFEEMFHLGTRVYSNTSELERLRAERGEPGREAADAAKRT
jgi:glycosyltransferase involved in cell wall biosynthesis